MNRQISTDFGTALARKRTVESIKTQAAKTACNVIKTRAREYLMCPDYLDMLRPWVNASAMTPDQLILFAKELLLSEVRLAPVTVVPVKMINAKSAILAGRYRRAKEHV